MASPLLSTRLTVSSRAASAPSSSSLSSVGGGAPSTINFAVPLPQRKTSAAPAASVCPSFSTRRRAVCSGGHVVKEGAQLLTSKFSGASVPACQVFSIRTTRRHASSSRNPALASPRSALVQKVTANELDSILSAERTSPMIIDFYATWCGPCVVLAQELEQLAVEYGEDIRFLKVDTDEEHELASQMEIRGLPTMVFVSKDVDKLAIRTEGLLPTDAIRDIIEKEILV